jgi:hypothetical protein
MMIETFEIDGELTRDAISCGIWTRLCNEMRGRSEGYRLEDYIGEPTEIRGDVADVRRYLDEDIGFLTKAQRMLDAVEQTPLGSKVEVDDIHRFMPRALHEKTGRWLWAPIEISEAEEEGGHVVMVRRFGDDERLRGD